MPWFSIDGILVTGTRGPRPQVLHKLNTFVGGSTHAVHNSTVSFAQLPGKQRAGEPTQIMKTYTLPIIMAALAVTHTAATAQTTPPPRPPLLMPVLDANRNGELSALEIKAASTALAKLDKDGNGTLSPKEIVPPPPAGSPAPNPLAPKPSPVLVKAIDFNKNGSLSVKEIEDAPAALKLLDKNKDGKITKAEITPPKPPAAV